MKEDKRNVNSDWFEYIRCPHKDCHGVFSADTSFVNWGLRCPYCGEWI